MDLVGFGIVIPVLPLYAERFGASPLTIGLLLGVYSAVQFVCAPLLGRISDRVGRRPVLLVSLLGTAAGFMLMGWADALWLLFVARIIDGATGGNLSTAMAYIADITPPEQRSRGMGLIGAAFGLGFIVGPALGGVMSQISLAAPFWTAAALTVANAVALALFLPESLPPERRQQARESLSWRQVFQEGDARSLTLVLGLYFLTTVAFSGLTATYPLFTNRRFGYGAAENGYLFAFQGILAAIVQGGLLGWLVKVAGDKRVIVGGIAVFCANLYVLPLSPTIAMLCVTTAGVAVSHGVILAILNGLASRRAGPAVQGRILGFMQAAASLARVVGPVLAGWLLQYDTLPATFGQTPYWTGAGIMAAAFLLAMTL